AFAHKRDISVPAKGYTVTKDAFEMSYKDDFAYPKASYDAFANPGMGWGLWAEVGEEGAAKMAFDYDLAYLQITWADLQTAKGKFDWTNVDNKYHISYWEDNNVNFIVRFIMDNPAELTGSRKDETYCEVVDAKFIKKNLGKSKIKAADVEKLIATSNYRTDIPAWVLAELCNSVLDGKLDNAGTFYNWPDPDTLGGG
ncbi:MAG: hypothetical protein J6S72_03565, partial [Lachnospiraceae bacterium]|nr:hypothetical protein [Lachnospiraceae bacterium]